MLLVSWSMLYMVGERLEEAGEGTNTAGLLELPLLLLLPPPGCGFEGEEGCLLEGLKELVWLRVPGSTV